MRILKNSFIYIGSEIFNKAIPFLLLPVITKYLTPEEYGLYGMYQVVLSFLTAFLGMNLQINITRNFFKVSKNEISKILMSLILLLHVHLAIGILLLYIVTLFWHNPFGISDNLVYIMPIIIYVQMLNTFNLTILRNQEKALKYGLFQGTLIIVNYATAILLLIRFEFGWESLVYGILLANSMLAVFSLHKMYVEYKIGSIFYSFKEIYIISLPMVFHLLGGSIIFLSDRIFIQQMLGLKAVGIYTIGSQFGMITSIMIGAILTAANPWFYRNLAEDNQKVVYKSYLLMGIFIIIGVIVWLGSMVALPLMVDGRYQNALSVIFWVSLAFVIRGFYQVMYNVIVHEGKTKVFMYLGLFTGTVNLVLNYFFIKSNGMVGAAQATCLAFLIMFLVTLGYANKYSKLKWIRT